MALRPLTTSAIGALKFKSPFDHELSFLMPVPGRLRCHHTPLRRTIHARPLFTLEPTVHSLSCLHSF